MKKKGVAVILAFFFGYFGAHRFYLGQRGRGILHFILAMFCLAITIDSGDPIVILPAILGFLDFVLLLAMPQQEFDHKYNTPTASLIEKLSRRTGSAPLKKNPLLPSKQKNEYKTSGIEKFREYDLDGAILDFQKALGINYQDRAIHFNLACCYSLLEKPDKALFHLSKSVEYGLTDMEKIHNHEALSYLRTKPSFQDFVANGYTVAPELPPPAPNLLDEQGRQQQQQLLDQITKLGELRDKGILTEEEFVQQKNKLLGKP